MCRNKHVLFLLAVTIFYSESLLTGNDLVLQTSIQKGIYLPDKKINIRDLRQLPIPKTNEDYAFIQCIDNTCNIITGRFSKGHREITMIKDRNLDNKVDLVVKWFVDTKRYKFMPKPSEIYPSEKFKKMKKEIIQGAISESLNPNKEGLFYLKNKLSGGENLRRWKQGYSCSISDPDFARKIRLNFFFSKNEAKGADLVFQVKYRNFGKARIKPVIANSVYCKKSKDKYIISLVDDLIKEASKYFTTAE